MVELYILFFMKFFMFSVGGYLYVLSVFCIWFLL